MSAQASNWAIHLAHAFWQSTLAALLVLVALRLFRDASPRLRHALACLALVKFVLPPMLPLPTGIFSAVPPVPELRAVRNFTASLDASLLEALMLLHLAGFTIALLRLGVQAARLDRIRRRATPCGDYLLSDDISVPLTTGRAILLPRALAATLSAEELHDVVEHEREHVRRGDVLTGILHSLVVALWWFHPLVHLLANEARLLREERCDDSLLARGTCQPAHYARTLLHAATFVSGRAPAGAAAIAGSPHALLRRVRRLADTRIAPALRLDAWAIVVVIVLALLLLPGLRVSHQNRFAFDHATRAALHH